MVIMITMVKFGRFSLSITVCLGIINFWIRIKNPSKANQIIKLYVIANIITL